MTASLLELVQIYLHIGNDGSEFAQLQIYQMLIRNMRIRDYAKVVSENFTEADLEDKIITCLRNMRDNCQQSGSQTLFSVEESQARTELTQSSVARPRNTAMKRMKRRIISHDRQQSSHSSEDSFDESEVNRNRAQHFKNRGPGLFELIRQRKAGYSKSSEGKANSNGPIPTTTPADWASQPQETSDDRIAEPESLPPLEEVPTPKTSKIPTFEIIKTQDNSFEINNKDDSKADETEKSVITKSLNNSKIPVTLPTDSSDDTDSEKDEPDKKQETKIEKSNAKETAKRTSPSSSDETDSEKEALLKKATQTNTSRIKPQSKAMTAKSPSSSQSSER